MYSFGVKAAQVALRTPVGQAVSGFVARETLPYLRRVLTPARQTKPSSNNPLSKIDDALEGEILDIGYQAGRQPKTPFQPARPSGSSSFVSEAESIVADAIRRSAAINASRSSVPAPVVPFPPPSVSSSSLIPTLASGSRSVTEAVGNVAGSLQTLAGISSVYLPQVITGLNAIGLLTRYMPYLIEAITSRSSSADATDASTLEKSLAPLENLAHLSNLSSLGVLSSEVQRLFPTLKASHEERLKGRELNGGTVNFYDLQAMRNHADLDKSPVSLSTLEAWDAATPSSFSTAEATRIRNITEAKQEVSDALTNFLELFDPDELSGLDLPNLEDIFKFSKFSDLLTQLKTEQTP